MRNTVTHPQESGRLIVTTPVAIEGPVGATAATADRTDRKVASPAPEAADIREAAERITLTQAPPPIEPAAKGADPLISQVMIGRSSMN